MAIVRARVMFVTVALCGMIGSAQVARSEAVTEAASPAMSQPRLFMVEAASDGCQIKRPGSERSEAMVRRKAYPFGSAMEVRQGGSAIITLSPGVRLAAGESTRLTIHEPAEAAAPYRVGVVSGQAVVTVQKSGELPLTVESAAGVVDAIQGQIDVRVQSRPDACKMRVAVLDGTVAVRGNQFKVAELKKNTAVDIEAAQNRSYTRLTTRSGVVQVSAEKGTEEEAVKLHVGQTLTISRSPVKGEERNAVSVVVAGPDGIMLQYVFVEGGAAAEVTVSKTEAAPRSAGGDAAASAGQGTAVSGEVTPWEPDQDDTAPATAVESNDWMNDNW